MATKIWILVVVMVLVWEAQSRTSRRDDFRTNMYSRIPKHPARGQRRYLTHFLRYDEIVSTLQNITAKYPTKARLVDVGRSYEGRMTYMLQLSDNYEYYSRKPIALISAGIHAREWAAPALAMHIIHQVLARPDLLAYYDWYIIPLANPDGYEYTHTKDRMWRKTRSRLSRNRHCVGADGNRNYNVHWGEIGASTDPCSDIFQGVGPLSEVEARNVAAVGKKFQNRIKVYVDLHSFGNFISYPYGHSRVPIPRWRELEKCGNQSAQAIIDVGGPAFTVGNTATVLYPAGGGSDDYMMYRYNVPFAYTVELPGGGHVGFDMPPQEISTMVHQPPSALALFNHHSLAHIFTYWLDRGQVEVKM